MPTTDTDANRPAWPVTRDTTAYIVCVTRNAAAAESYLYGYAATLFERPVLKDNTVKIILVNGERALSYAEGQADRLSSGLHFSRAFPTLLDALSHTLDTFGVKI